MITIKQFWLFPKKKHSINVIEYINIYNDLAVVNHEDDWSSTFYMIYVSRYYKYKKKRFEKGCMLNKIEPATLINASEGDLPTFIFMMNYYESEQFRSNLPSNLQAAAWSIYQTIKLLKPETILHKEDIFFDKISIFVRY